MSNYLYRRPTQIDLFTDSYRVSGRAMIGTGGIYAELDNPNSSFLELQDAYISRINEPGEIILSYETAAFRKDNINFIILQDRREGVAVGTQHGRSVFTRGRPTQLFVTVPSFEISGTVMYEGSATPQSLVIQSFGSYLMAFDAEAKASVRPELTYSGDLIMIHKDRIGILCLDAKRQ